MASNLFRMIDGNGRGYVTTDDMAKAVASSPEIAEVCSAISYLYANGGF